MGTWEAGCIYRDSFPLSSSGLHLVPPAGEGKRMHMAEDKRDVFLDLEVPSDFVHFAIKFLLLGETQLLLEEVRMYNESCIIFWKVLQSLMKFAFSLTSWSLPVSSQHLLGETVLTCQ